MSDLEPQAGEEPPVDIVNNSFIQPFEAVTRLYGMPGHKDLDPTLFLAGFFFLFFGLSLTDVGYGIFLMAVATMILTLFKVAPVVRTFAKLLLFMGLGSALVGLLFGGYLGIAPESLPSWLRAIQLFDPIGNPLPVFYLALGLGVFQVMVGMFLKIYSDARNGELMNGILDQGPWLFVFFAAIAYLGVTTGYLNIIATPDQLINLIYVGLVLVVLASGRKGKTILEKVQSAALSLYASIGYFSDILSYSRLLALGLATTALAFAVNLIAEIVYDAVPYVGIVFAGLVLVIGHTFTLAVNTLGAFIHSARLQFVEFFGKFISGTGRLFRPFAREKSYVSITPDK
jgi:V/A-type H+-transporting ATPase subunit I